MSLISQIFFAIVITSFTGTGALGIWKLLQKILLKWNPDLVYLILRCVCLLYVLPVGYVLIQFTVGDGYIQSDDMWQMNFSATWVMSFLYLSLECMWAVLTVKGIVSYIYQGLKWRAFRRTTVPEENEAAREEFLRVKKELGVHRNIHLCRNEKFGSAMITGIFRCSVILPTEEFSREQLRVIFYHELTHYKSCDLLYKLCGICVGVIHYWNPFSKRLLKLLEEWSEYDCDRKAIAAMRPETTTGHYFEMIMDTMRQTPEIHGGDYIFSMLYENQTSLERRIDYMRKYNEIKKAGKFVSVVLIAVFVLTNVSTSYAAGSKMADIQDTIYKGTEQTSSMNDIVMEEGMIFIPAGTDSSFADLVYGNPEAETIMPVLDEEEVASFNWVVSPDTRYVSGKLSLKSGQKVSVSCTTLPPSSTYWIGIMNVGGDVWYYEGTGSLGYNFSVNAKGTYRVLVQNRSTVDITSTGSYYYYTP